MTDNADIAARVAAELRWQTFLFASRDRIMASFAERWSADIAAWSSQIGSRPQAVESLRAELAQLADEAFTWRTGEFVRRLAAATGSATAIWCAPAHAPSEVDWPSIACMADELAENLRDDTLWLEVVTASDEERLAFRAVVRLRLHRAATRLEVEDPASVLAWCVNMVFSLWTTDLGDDEFDFPAE